MPKIAVGYTVPVECIVDTDTGAVVRVIVWDEEVTLDRDDCERDGKSISTDLEHGPVTDQAVRDKALAIAEVGGWPAWDFGR